MQAQEGNGGLEQTHPLAVPEVTNKDAELQDRVDQGELQSGSPTSLSNGTLPDTAKSHTATAPEAVALLHAELSNIKGVLHPQKGKREQSDSFGSIIPDTGSPSAAVQERAANEHLKEVPTAATLGHKRTASLDVETGSFSAPESGKLDQASIGDEDDTSEIPLDAPEEPASAEEIDRSLKSVPSEEGSVIVHSTPGSTPTETAEEKRSEETRSTPKPRPDEEVSTSCAYVTARAEPFADADQDADLRQESKPAAEAARKLETDFDQADPPSGTEHVQHAVSTNSSGIKVDNSRPGVTASPPRSPKQSPALPLPGALGKPALTKSEQGSVAEDLAEAEARADLAALAASQRASSLNKQVSGESVPAEDAAPFTEEALSGEEVGKETTPPPEETPPVRPFSPPPGGARVVTQADLAQEQSFEPAEFRGLVFHDGVDALGRPVIVVNADAVGPKTSRKAACSYMLQRLEPIVIQGPYVLVFLNTGKSSRSNRLTAGWLAASYREMSYPFKKNVKHVILVRPSASLTFMLAIMRPLISKKAYVKLKKVDNLTAMAAATNSEVTLQHLGPRFAAAAGQSIISAEGLGRGGLYQMPAFGDVEMSDSTAHRGDQDQ